MIDADEALRLASTVVEYLLARQSPGKPAFRSLREAQQEDANWKRSVGGGVYLCSAPQRKPCRSHRSTRVVACKWKGI